MKKVALFAFNGEAMCFVHVLLNALEMRDKGYEVKMVIEGTATKLIKDLTAAPTAFTPLYEKVKANIDPRSVFVLLARKALP